ncbi:MAG: hypothetical protein ABSB73_08020 [Solirubrobacteraceae bacterium]
MSRQILGGEPACGEPAAQVLAREQAAFASVVERRGAHLLRLRRGRRREARAEVIDQGEPQPVVQPGENQVGEREADLVEAHRLLVDACAHSSVLRHGPREARRPARLAFAATTRNCRALQRTGCVACAQ